MTIPNLQRDPTRQTWLLQSGLKSAGYDIEPDNWRGPKTERALRMFQDSLTSPAPPHGQVLNGDGTWSWKGEIDGEDIVVRNVRATCFGGANDPQDSGETASGISTKENPQLAAVSLPMDGRMFNGLSSAEHRALDGSPIPRIPWRTVVRVESNGKSLDVPVIDLGPAKRTGNAIDLTIAAARFFNPNASATNFEMQCNFTIIGGAKFATV